DGPRRTEIEQFARDNGIRNFQYRGYFGREELRYSLSVGDVHLISLRKPFVGISVPGKLYGIMASARPALFVGPRECESAVTILGAACGDVVEPTVGSEGNSLAELLRISSESYSAVSALGQAGRRAFEET